MITVWLALIPSIYVLMFAIFTKKTHIALFTGIFLAALCSTHFSFQKSFKIGLLRLTQEALSFNNVCMFLFLFLVGMIIELITYTGAARAIGDHVTKRLRSTRAAEIATITLSSTLFFDDYLNTLSVGSIMQPLTDRFAIPRAKLAYLVDSMAAPLTILVPMTSWVAVITRELEHAGVSDTILQTTLITADPLIVYIQSIPFIFYSILTIITVWIIVLFRISFGPMRLHEKCAQKTGSLFNGKKPVQTIQTKLENQAHVIDFLFPLVTMLTTTICSFLYSGGFHPSQGLSTLLSAFQQADVFLSLCIGGTVAFVASIIFALVRKTIRIVDIFGIIRRGFVLMWPAVFVLYLAWSFGSVLRQDLHTGEIVAKTITGLTHIAWLPVVFFIGSFITTIAIGSSWATVAILTNITISMLHTLLHLNTPATLSSIPLLYPMLGAVLSGAVAGDHLSPLSDTTIMSTTSTGAYLMDHAYTQFMYAIPVFIGTAGALYVSGMYASSSWYISLTMGLCTGIILTLLGLFFCTRISAWRMPH